MIASQVIEHTLGQLDIEPDLCSIPEKQLACAVLERAVEDAQLVVITPYLRRAKAEALQFLRARGDRWARSRVFWCDLAGIDPEVFDIAVERILQ